MTEVVCETTLGRNPLRCIFSNAGDERRAAYLGMAKEPRHRPTFIRQWRQHRGYSLDQLAERVPMDKGNLSKVERGLLPYNQDLLERLADALQTDPASLLMRDPTNQDAIWSIWDRASAVERAQLEGVANALLESRRRA
jgi:transcriptional regulator with XRE-family HTH domain